MELLAIGICSEDLFVVSETFSIDSPKHKPLSVDHNFQNKITQLLQSFTGVEFDRILVVHHDEVITDFTVEEGN